MLKFFLGVTLGAGVVLCGGYFIAEYSYVPEIISIKHGGRALPWFDAQFHQVMEAQRQRFFADTRAAQERMDKGWECIKAHEGEDADSIARQCRALLGEP